MTIPRLVLYSDDDNGILMTRATPVTAFDTDLLNEVAKEIDSVLRSSGGLAVSANQVGSNLAMFGYIPDDGSGDTYFVVNPHLTFLSPHNLWTYREGCLSLPGRFWYINRPDSVAMTGYSLTGESVTVLATGLKGRVFQHECDHLKGRTILDRVSLHERKKALRELRKGGPSHD